MITLKPITFDNLIPVTELKLEPYQEDYLASNVFSVAQAYVALKEGVWQIPFALYHMEDLVGFIMMGHAKQEANGLNEYFEPGDCYDIFRFMIDKRHQKKGYGREAMLVALEYLRTQPNGPADAIFTSYWSNNTVARHLYASLGFVETGKETGGETIARLPM